MSLEKVIIFAEEAAAYEELCSGVRALGAQPVALLVGSEADSSQVAGYGARVFSFGERAEGVMLEDYTQAFADVIAAEEPGLVMMRASKRTQCIAGRLAVKLNAGVVSDVSAIEVEGDQVSLSHLVYGGAAKQVEKVAGLPIALVGSGLFEVAAASAAGAVEQQSASVVSGPIKITGIQEKQEETVDLGAAKRVVCVGRGIGSAENISSAKGFADRIGAEMACTRPIAEGEGWMARSRYLGVSGAVVKPDVYLALGVSGQVQHTVGASESKIIAAINKDKNAPIFKNCDYGLVADVEKVLPYLQ